MQPQYLEQLGLSADALQKVQQYAAATPEALLGMFYAATDAFRHHLGVDTAERLRRRLEALVSPATVARLQQPTAHGALGSRLESAPLRPIDAEQVLYRRRDELLRRIDELESRRAPVGDLDRAHAELDQVLTQIFATTR